MLSHECKVNSRLSCAHEFILCVCLVVTHQCNQISLRPYLNEAFMLLKVVLSSHVLITTFMTCCNCNIMRKVTEVNFLVRVRREITKVQSTQHSPTPIETAKDTLDFGKKT